MSAVRVNSTQLRERALSASGGLELNGFCEQDTIDGLDAIKLELENLCFLLLLALPYPCVHRKYWSVNGSMHASHAHTYTNRHADVHVCMRTFKNANKYLYILCVCVCVRAQVCVCVCAHVLVRACASECGVHAVPCHAYQT